MILPLSLLEKLTSAEFLVLEILAEKAREEGKREIDLPHKAMTLVLKRTPQGINYNLKSLQKKGYLDIITRWPGKPNTYILSQEIWEKYIKPNVKKNLDMEYEI